MIADLHIHSRFSRATSRELRPETLYLWAQRKGIQLLGTGDFTHPEWLVELEEKLEPAEEGLWRLNQRLASDADSRVPPSCRGPVRFVFQGEISTIYKRNGRTRKVHHLVLVPDMAAVRRLVGRLERVGNLRADGRPILGLDSRDLLEIVLEACPEAIFIPAHVWTPWFSVFGSRSGFDDVEECYGDLIAHISALETGLSSDPSMNWRWSRLDRFRLVSNSDAHSPSRLGREANVLQIPLCYGALREALRSGTGLAGTIEFFPEEGKYHLDGHRTCRIRMDALETRRQGGLCPACGKPVTVGVLHRVELLADRPSHFVPAGAKHFQRLLPLGEILGEVLGCGPATRRVEEWYDRLLARWGPELHLLRHLPLEEVRGARMFVLAEALGRMREGRVLLEPGFDGQYGTVRIFQEGERAALEGQHRLLAVALPSPRENAKSAPDPPPEAARTWPVTAGRAPSGRTSPSSLRGLPELHRCQRDAVFHEPENLMVIAGPGTGKTLTLTHRIARFLREKIARPTEVLAVTFTHRAAREMRTRLMDLLDSETMTDEIPVLTLHAFGLKLLRDHWRELGEEGLPFVVDEEARIAFLAEAVQQAGLNARPGTLPAMMERISRWKQRAGEDSPPEALVADLAKAYDAQLRRNGALDYDDLLRIPLLALQSQPEMREQVRRQVRFLFVDEYQDFNPLQMRLVEALVGPEGCVTVIGDPDQSIYAFRGADPSHFVRIRETFPGTQVLRLEESYRSTATIVQSGSAVISGNSELFPRVLRPRRDPGPPVRVRGFPSGRAEAIFVAQEIDRLVGGTSHWAMSRKQGAPREDGSPEVPFGEIGVLCRLHALFPVLEEALARDGIPFQRYGERHARPTQSVAHLMAGLRWLMDPRREEDLLAALSAPTVGLPPEILRQVRGSAAGPPVPLWERLEDLSGLPGIQPRDGLQLQRQMALFRGVLREFDAVAPGEIVGRMLSALRIPRPDPAAPWDPGTETLRRFLDASLSRTADLVSLVDEWSLLAGEDLYDPRSDRVSLMTVHAAKGLEFPVVFLTGCEEGLFPHGSGQGPDLEEERRLFFVGMSRAQDLLYLTWAKTRALRGQTRESAASRFLEEIPSKLKDTSEEKPSPPRPATQLKLF